MTMLDRMRRHRSWLKWSLGIVCGTFVLLYIPAFLRGGDDGTGAAASDVIASVDGHEVTVGTYQRLYQDQVQRIRASYGGTLDDQMLRQLQIGQRIVQQLVEEQAVLSEADRLGITVSDAELRERILRMPGFQENGQFIGEARYEQILKAQRPPLRPVDFQEDVRRSLIAEKLQTATTSWLRVPDAEVDAEYRKRNEKVKADFAVFTANQFRAGIQPTDADLTAQFAAHADAYKIPEKRRVKYLSIDADALRSKMVVAPAEVDARYKANIQTYSTPEQVRVSHILFKTDGKNDETVKKKAQDVLAKVKAGADFATLAKQYSEDDGSKVKGGDLDYFGKGTMFKEFEDAAWGMKPGEVSNLVKSPVGFHIIKFTDKKAAATKTLAEVRPQIEDQIKSEKAQAEAQKAADDVAKEIKTPADLDRVAKARGLTVGDSGLFSRDEPLAGLGFAPAVSAEAFTVDQGKVSGLLRTNQGYAFISVVEVKPPYVPQLAEVKDKVRDDVIRLKAVDVAKAKAETMARTAGTNFAAAAKAAGVEVKSTDWITRGSALPEIGMSGTVDTILFKLKTGETSVPIPTDTAVVVAHVKERQDIDQTKFLTDRDTLKAELTQQRRQEFFGAYMTKAKKNMKINFNETALRTILGG